MRIAAIDIGTNTILMVIGEMDEDGGLRILRDEHAVVRLGEGVDIEKRIRDGALDRALDCLKQYKILAGTLHVDAFAACGTSALRDASNRDVVIRRVKAETGLSIRVLNGNREADLTYLGTVDEFLEREKSRGFIVLDIGGGSTELTRGSGSVPSARESIDIGSVRLTERYLKTSPPAADSLEAARAEIRKRTALITPVPAGTRLIGVAGTLTTLAAIDLGLYPYDREAVSGHVLSLQSIRRSFELLRSKTVAEIRAIPQILPQRADIIFAGTLILTEMMERLKAVEITVSDRGLRFGILLEEFRRQRSAEKKKLR